MYSLIDRDFVHVTCRLLHGPWQTRGRNLCEKRYGIWSRLLDLRQYTKNSFKCRDYLRHRWLQCIPWSRCTQKLQPYPHRCRCFHMDLRHTRLYLKIKRRDVTLSDAITCMCLICAPTCWCSAHGNSFSITEPLWGQIAGYRCFPLTLRVSNGIFDVYQSLAWSNS